MWSLAKSGAADREQEKTFRKDPVSASSAIVRKVFGALH